MGEETLTDKEIAQGLRLSVKAGRSEIASGGFIAGVDEQEDHIRRLHGEGFKHLDKGIKEL